VAACRIGLHSFIAFRPAAVIRRYAIFVVPAPAASRCTVARPACTKSCSISKAKPRAIRVDKEYPRCDAASICSAARWVSVRDMHPARASIEPGLFFRETRQEVAKRNPAGRCRGVLGSESDFSNSYRERKAVAADLPTPGLRMTAV
jgi:hypothetical protein